jgi:iron complex transport system substrate-binding protein
MKKVFRSRKILVIVLALVILAAGCGKKTVVEEVYETESANTEETIADEAIAPEKQVAIPKENEFLTEYPYTYKDKFGNEVTIEKRPETIVSFAPEITETIYALGVGDKLVGRSTYCDYPPEVSEVQDMGTLFEFSIEAVVELNPDLVFLSSMVSEDVYQQLVNSGLKVAAFDYDADLGGTQTQIETIGTIIDRNDQATVINYNIQKAIDSLSAKAKDREAKSVYFAVSVGEYTSAATGDTFINDIIEATGATNAAADGTSWMYTVEQLVENDPDYILCSNKWDTKAKIKSLEGYKDLTAVKEGRLYAVDENVFFRQGPRVVEALYAVEAVVFSAD